MASNTILAYAMEQGDKMALIGMRNPVLGKADVSAAQGSSPGKVQGSVQWSKKGGCGKVLVPRLSWGWWHTAVT